MEESYNKLFDESNSFFDSIKFYEDSYYFKLKEEESEKKKENENVIFTQNIRNFLNFSDIEKKENEINDILSIFNENFDYKEYKDYKDYLIDEYFEDKCNLEKKNFFYQNSIEKSFLSSPSSELSKENNLPIEQNLTINQISSLYKTGVDSKYSSSKEYSNFSKRKRERNSLLSQYDIDSNNKTESNNKIDNSNSINIKNKNSIFNTKIYNKKGRKTKDSGQKGKHDKYYFDNISKAIKSLTIDFLIDKINLILEKFKALDLNEFKDKFGKVKLLTINNYQAINSSKKYNQELLDKSIREILNQDISGKYNYEKNFNKNLLIKLYKFKENENPEYEEIKKLINLLNLKLKDFYAILSLYKYNPEIINEIDDSYDILKELIEAFPSRVDNYLKNKNESEQYKEVFKSVLEDFHLRFN